MLLQELIVPLLLDKDNFDKGVDGAVSKSEQLRDKLTSLGKGAVLAGIAGITALVTTATAAITFASKATFKWADDIDGLGDVIGGTNLEMASMAFVARKAGVDVSALTQANVIMEKSLVKADGTLDTVGQSLKDYGINVKDVNGKVKSQTQIMNEVAKKYATFGTQQEKVNFLTEAFGKSGAQLIDYFDVLASEGGIDAVSKKVEAFGLAIDPARYEEFNRNLEELKLIGTGLAVTFTEKLMPTFEKLMEWSTTFASAPIGDKLKMMLDPLKLLFNLTDMFEKGVDDIDWDSVSNRLAEKIKNVDWATVGLYIREGVGNVLQGIGTVIEEIDWQALADSSGKAFADLVAGLYGYPDWDALSVDFNEGMSIAFDDMKAFTLAEIMEIGEIIFNAIVKDLAPVEERWDNLIEGMKEKWLSLIDLIQSISGIDVNLPSLPATAGSGSGSSGSAGSGGGGRRASGGAVIAGQSYQVSEFYKPEVFTPNRNGRIDTIKENKQPELKIDYARIGMEVRDALLTSGALG